MWKRLLGTVLLLGLAAYSLGSETVAIFTDVAVSSGSFRAGSLDLRYRMSQDGGLHWSDWVNGDTARFSLPQLTRGQSGQVLYQVQNQGTVDGLFNLKGVTVTDYENGLTWREQGVDNTPDAGELSQALLVTVRVGDTVIYTGPLRDFHGDYNLQAPVIAGGIVSLVMDWLLPNLDGAPPEPPPAFLFKSGTYIGDGNDSRPITGAGFPPDVVIIKDDDHQVAVLRSAAMPGDSTKPLVGGTSLQANMIQSLDTDGFTIGAHAAVNASGRSYFWMAFKAAVGEMKVGSYTGNGGLQAIDAVGFAPAYVIVMSESDKKAVQRSSAMPATFSFDGDSGDDDRITSLDADGFTVGDSSRVNSSGVTYYYVVWKAVAGRMGVGFYLGDGQDNHSITGVGFAPQYVITRPEGSADDKRSAHKPAASGPTTDLSLDFSGDNDSNEIQALEADGFQVGSDKQVNEAGKTFYWMAFASGPGSVGSDVIDSDSAEVSFAFEIGQQP